VLSVKKIELYLYKKLYRYNLTIIEMNSNKYDDICDDWGWYIDTDNNSFVSSTKFHPNKHYKNLNNYKLKLYTVNEDVDEYDYYKNNYRDIEKIQLDCSNKKMEKNEKSGYQISLYNIRSTTIITPLLTFLVIATLLITGAGEGCAGTIALSILVSCS
jgi:hypothetical protein